MKDGIAQTMVLYIFYERLMMPYLNILCHICLSSLNNQELVRVQHP